MSNRTLPTLTLRSVAGLLLAAAAGLPAAAQDQKAQEQRARSLLAQIREAQVTEGATICAELNSPAAVDLLLETLAETRSRSSRHLPPAHYRDVVWDALIAITDSYARRRVHDELVRNTDDALVRQVVRRAARHLRRRVAGAGRAAGDQGP